MPEGIPPHEKIRFARGEIRCLDSLPSARLAHGGRRQSGRLSRLAAVVALAPVALALVVVTGLYAAVSFGAGGEFLRQQAQRSIAAFAGHPVEVEFGGTALTMSGGTLLSLQIEDARISDARDGRLLAEAGSIGFGVRLLPLLVGKVQLGSARIADARLAAPPPVPAADGSGFWEAISDERGLVDTGRLGHELFRAMHRALDGLDDSMTERFELANVEIALGEAGTGHSVMIDKARLFRTGAHIVSLEARMAVGGRPVGLEWTASRSARGTPIENLEAQIVLEPIAADHDGILGRNVNAVRLKLSGREGDGGFERLDVQAEIDGAVFAAGRSSEAVFNASVSAYTEAGLDKIEIAELYVANGSSFWRFNGAIGPMPVGQGPDVYRYELVSDGSRVAPAASLEPAVDVLARIAGAVEPNGRRVSADEIAVRTADGEVNGNAAVTIEAGKSVGLDLDIHVTDLSVANAKQLWPWFAVSGARKWVHENLFGGRVVEGRVALSVEPGRFGDGVPLGPDEVSGRFAVERVRFDVAGRIPPVREGVGRVDFAGTDVDVHLESGVVFLASGRSVAASNGLFRIDAHPDTPLIGELEIDVAGEASAIVELAGYEPISVDRYLEFGPDDFSGEVSGKIVADIPLRAGVVRDDLEWMVMLDYADLSLARPFNGHDIAGAHGSILVEPQRVVIDAEARLDGMPARVNLVEPLGADRSGRRQDISLDLSNAERDRLLPGLATILSGKASVELRGDASSRRSIDADLANSTLSLPWAGWSKGTGIPARASFFMETSGARTVLEDFALGGDTFSVNGRLTLEGGQLASARFDRVRLNREDDFSVALDRAGGGYRVKIAGRSFDARSLIRQLNKDAEAAGDAAGGAPIVVDASLDELRGFHGEVLRDVSMEYRGTGSTVERLDFTATTMSGQPVSFRQTTVEGRREIAMQSADAGALVRFLDIYERMEGGRISLALSGAIGDMLTGHVSARDFWIVNEPRLGSIVSTTPAGGDRSLNDAVRSQIDASRVHIERGFAEIDKRPGYLGVAEGVLRGPTIGTTFRGVLYDPDGNMDLAGTFMPAYGINSIFGQIPIFGQILGNGRDGALIGITYRLSGKAGEPQLQVNPLSAVAPGIFRSVFEFN